MATHDEETKDGLHPTPADAIFEAMPQYQPTVGISPVDGLPVDNTPDVGEDAYAPSLDPETFVCMRHVDGAGNLIRKQCSYYKRQKQQHPDIPRILVIQRWCTHPAVVTSAGAMCLRDSTVPNCELREPPDQKSSDDLDAFDDELVRKGKDRKFLQVFRTPDDVKSGRTSI